MFFALIGFCVFAFFLFYAIGLYFTDCNLQLALSEKFGSSIGRLKGKVVFITGASSGIGQHTAIALARHGVKLVLAARRKDALETVKNTCLSVSNGLLSDDDVLVLAMDMIDLQSHKAHFQTAVDHFGGIDVIFNNAGRSQRGAWADTELQVDREMFEINVFSIVNLTRIAIKYFTAKGSGHIAVDTSLNGIMFVPFVGGTYAGSKHALHGYFNILRSEMAAKNVTVSLICPGPVASNIISECFTEKHGQKYGIPMHPNDDRMSGERCGQLCAVALANKLHEAWIAQFPFIHFTYIATTFPTMYQWMLKLLGPKVIYRIREQEKD